MAQHQMKLEQAARQALVALEDVMADFDGSWVLADTAITALREALAEQAEGAIVKTCPDGYGTITTEQAEQRSDSERMEPVAEALSIDEALATLHASLKDGAKYGGWPINRNCEDGLNALTTLREVLALREALAVSKQRTEEQTEPSQLADASLEAVAWMNTNGAVNKLREAGWAMNAAPQPVKQEPVAWKDLTYGNLHHQDFGNSIPLYAAPVRTKNLTDDEWQQLFNSKGVYLQTEHAGEVARAVIAADREKNK